jgi:hypothetical protein
VCFNFLFSLHLGALVSIHPHPAVVAAATAAWKCILFFKEELCRAQRTRKTREKRQPEEKKTKEFIHKPFVWSGEKLILRLSATDLSAAFALSPRAMKLYEETVHFKFDHYRCRGVFVNENNVFRCPWVIRAFVTM